ncbi:hypothetical protein [Paenibacillus ferrarius]|uniref:hypothetical protein n=1 Tax=Paenibacillus ferrarius TaxID=1469647 RepID=UPI001301A7CB|nr:hypothetical protein [Paenibacillus ferrarius]
MSNRYNQIIEKIRLAREAGNEKQVKMWRNKLSKWRAEYGANQPITSSNYHRYE